MMLVWNQPKEGIFSYQMIAKSNVLKAVNWFSSLQLPLRRCFCLSVGSVSIQFQISTEARAISCLEELVRKRKFSGVSPSAARLKTLSEDFNLFTSHRDFPRSLTLEKFVTFHWDYFRTAFVSMKWHRDFKQTSTFRPLQWYYHKHFCTLLNQKRSKHSNKIWLKMMLYDYC